MAASRNLGQTPLNQQFYSQRWPPKSNNTVKLAKSMKKNRGGGNSKILLHFFENQDSRQYYKCV
jgi:hypothetical protein